MTVFPCAKINLGLQVTERRLDGYHNLETVFFPVRLTDALEVNEMDEDFPSERACDLKVTGTPVDGDEQDNLVVKAYNLLASRHKVPRVHVHLLKRIPSQAGMGGGSSDAAFMLNLLNTRFSLGEQPEHLRQMAASLGADCAFFINPEPAFATGIGDKLTPLPQVSAQLHGRWLAVVKPPVSVSTREAYAGIKPQKPQKCCREIVAQPVETWRHELTNDFETSIFAAHPEVAAVKQWFYDHGAVFALMSGSGSAVFAIYDEPPTNLAENFPLWFTCVVRL